VVAAQTGGIGSFAAIWLVVAPLEASLSGSRRALVLASIIALVATGLLFWLSTSALVLPLGVAQHELAALAALAIVSAALYAAGLALGAESLARTGMELFRGEEDRYRLLAHNMTDVITRHGHHGNVLFVSPAAEAMVGVPIRSLYGHGLFDRVHVTDRPAYLKALSDAAASGHAQSAQFRVRRQVPQERTRMDDAFVWVEMRYRPLGPVVKDRASNEPQEVVAVCAISASTRFRSKRWKRRAPRQSAPIRPKDASSPP
jgi:cell cycle sensor histidine kinase DivJ